MGELLGVTPSVPSPFCATRTRLTEAEAQYCIRFLGTKAAASQSSLCRALRNPGVGSREGSLPHFLTQLEQSYRQNKLL